MKVLIIIPVYNEAGNIVRVLSRIKKANINYDILVVDDGSTDNSSNICSGFCNVSVLRLSSNLGIGGARQAGFKYAYYNDYEAVIQLDGDNQHNPEYIESMISKLREGYNICIGSRFIKRIGFQSSILRRIGINILLTEIQLITGLKFSDPTSGFRACDKTAIKLFSKEYPQDYPEPESIILAKQNRLKICEVPIVMNKREAGKSSISRRASFYFMTKVTIAILLSVRHNGY